MTSILLLVLALAQLPDLRQAWELGRTKDEKALASFSTAYQLPVSGIVESAEVFTEFRRAVMLTHENAVSGTLAFTPVELGKVMTPFEGKVTFVVQVRLNPLNTLTKTPAYDMYVSTGRFTKAAEPKGFKRDPVYAFMAGPRTPAPLVGVRLEATYLTDAIAASAAPVLNVVDEKANLLWQAPIDLSRFR